MSLKTKVKKSIPPGLLNQLLLTFPGLYHTRLINYETTISPQGIAELLTYLARAIELPGDIVECGSSRCGSSIIMARLLQAQGVDKRIWAYDSFQGFDRQELARERAEGWTTVSDKAFTSTSLEYVHKKLQKLGVADIINPCKGYFQETLPHHNQPVCLAFIDCDLKDSLIYCAETLWPHLVSQGYILFDDYTEADFKGARFGVDDFVSQHGSEIKSHALLERLYLVQKG